MRDTVRNTPSDFSTVEGVSIEDVLEFQRLRDSANRKFSTSEIGTPGLKVFSGIIRQAYNAELNWPQVYPIYHRIRQTDPEIGIIRTAFTAWSRRVDLILELPENASDDDKKVQEYGYQVLDEVQGGTSTLTEGLVNYAPFMGWMWYETPFGLRNHRSYGKRGWSSRYDDGLPSVRSFEFRDHSSFHRWDIDDRDKILKGMLQMDPPNQIVNIPLNRSLHIKFGDPNSPEGLSPLAALWRMERTKFALELVFGIGAEHTAGHLNVKTESKQITSQDEEYVSRAANAVLAATQGNYALWPKGFDGKIESGPFQAAATLLEAIRYYGLIKLQLYMMQGVAIATTANTGTYSSSASAADAATLMFNGMMEGFAQQIDDQLGPRLFENRLVQAAFPNMTRRPRFRFTPLESRISLSELSNFAATLFPLMPVSKHDWIAIRRASGFLPETMPAPEDEVEVGPPEEEDRTDPFSRSQALDDQEIEDTADTAPVNAEREAELSRRPFMVSPEEYPTTTTYLVSELTQEGIDRIHRTFVRWAEVNVPLLAEAVQASINPKTELSFIQKSLQKLGVVELTLGWDERRGSFVKSDGRSVSDDTLDRAFSSYISEKIEADLSNLTTKMIEGDLTLSDWQERGARILKEGWVNGLHVGRGGKLSTDFSDYGRIGGRLRVEYSRWDIFAEEIKLGNLSRPQILDRVSKYASGPRTALFDGRTSAKRAAEFSHEQRILDPLAEHCNSCLEYASRGPVPIGTLPEPGDRCECNRRCRCEKVYLRDADLPS